MREREREREKENARKKRSFVSLGLLAWAWKRPEASSNWPMSFPSFHELLIGLYPLDRLTDLYGPAPDLAPS